MWLPEGTKHVALCRLQGSRGCSFLCGARGRPLARPSVREDEAPWGPCSHPARPRVACEPGSGAGTPSPPRLTWREHEDSKKNEGLSGAAVFPDSVIMPLKILIVLAVCIRRHQPPTHPVPPPPGRSGVRMAHVRGSGVCWLWPGPWLASILRTFVQLLFWWKSRVGEGAEGWRPRTSCTGHGPGPGSASPAWLQCSFRRAGGTCGARARLPGGGGGTAPGRNSRCVLKIRSASELARVPVTRSTRDGAVDLGPLASPCPCSSPVQDWALCSPASLRASPPSSAPIRALDILTQPSLIQGVAVGGGRSSGSRNTFGHGHWFVTCLPYPTVHRNVTKS